MRVLAIVSRSDRVLARSVDAVSCGMARPDVFACLSFDAALERSRADGSIVIVDAMAVWCGPCRAMDRTTWVDPDVVARLSGAGGAFAIQIDVDAEPAVAARLEITAMPTLVAFVAGVEHDRVVGGRGPADLIAWLDIVARGERFEDAQRAARREVQERVARARDALAAGRHAEALPECVWLWTNLPNVAADAAFVGELANLVATHAPARAAFGELRDAAAPPTDEPPDIATLHAWTALNQIVDDRDATLRWYDANGLDLPPSRAVARFVELAIVPLLVERGRWRAVGIALQDPAATFRFYVDAERGIRPGDMRRHAAQLVRALYAAGREERANDLEFEARDVDASPEMIAILAEARALGRADR